MIIPNQTFEDYIKYDYYESANSLNPSGTFSISKNFKNMYYLFDIFSFATGVGSQMMIEIIKLFNNKPLVLDVREDNARARHVYEKFGFKSVYFWSNEKDITYIEMRREVNNTYE